MNQDPLGFLGNNKKDVEGPPPPELIPADEPDQNDLPAAYQPTSTMDVNLETYFLQNIKDPNVRMQRLENVVMAMHRDMQTSMNIQPLRKQMDPNGMMPGEPAPVGGVAAQPLGQYPAAQGAPMMVAPSMPAAGQPLPVPPTPAQYQQQMATPRNYSNAPQQPIYYRPAMPPPDNGQGSFVQYNVPSRVYQVSFDAPAPTERRVAEPAFNGGKAMITGFRVGEHPDKVRVVFDTSAKTPFTADLDNAERLLIVEMPQGQWTAPMYNDSFGRRTLVTALSTEQVGQGTRAILQLNGNTTILSQTIYPDVSGTGGRIVIDLSK